MTTTANDPPGDADTDLDLQLAGRRRHPVVRWVVVALALAVLFGWALVAGRGLGRDPRIVPSPLLGKPVPAFTLPVLGGGTFASDGFASEILVVNFWASWCVPCREEALELEAFSQRWSGRGVSLVGIVYNDREASASAFRERFGLTYPQVLDPNGRTALNFGVYGVLDQVVAAVEQGKLVTTKNDRYRTGPGKT